MTDQPVAQGDPKPGDVIRDAVGELWAWTSGQGGEYSDKEHDRALAALDELEGRLERALGAEATNAGAADDALARAEAAEAKLNAIGLLLDVDAEHTGWDRIRELKAQLAQAERALESLRQMGEDISDMAEDFITARDVTSLRNYGSNVQNIARRTLEQGDKDAS